MIIRRRRSYRENQTRRAGLPWLQKTRTGREVLKYTMSKSKTGCQFIEKSRQCWVNMHLNVRAGTSKARLQIRPDSVCTEVRIILSRTRIASLEIRNTNFRITYFSTTLRHWRKTSRIHNCQLSSRIGLSWEACCKPQRRCILTSATLRWSCEDRRKRHPTDLIWTLMTTSSTPNRLSQASHCLKLSSRCKAHPPSKSSMNDVRIRWT